MTDLEELQSIHWEMYKDAYGVRPRHVDTSTWTEQDFNQEFKVLQQAIDREEQERKDRQAVAIVEFEDRVANLLTSATNRARIIEWLMDAEGANGDFEYFCYTQGLPYGYLTNPVK
jgi:hypothetical protein